DESLFVEDRLHRAFGSWSAQASAGARYDRFDTFGSQISPRIAVALASGANRFRAAWGEAFRAPSINELYSPFGGNRDLQPERTRNAEAGFDRAFGASRFSATLFRADYRDLITNSGFVFANVGHARSRGAELSLERDFAARVYGLASYTFADTKQTETGRALLRRPRHSGSLVLGTHRGALDANADFTFLGRRADVQPVAPFGRTTAPPYATLDLNLQFHAGRSVPFLKIENATDRRYQEVAGYPSPRRRVIAGLRFTI
ncbi:MAG TPA: TonB-dependent receptor, partial [Thermoanaerobaculia bacterium]